MFIHYNKQLLNSNKVKTTLTVKMETGKSSTVDHSPRIMTNEIAANKSKHITESFSTCLLTNAARLNDTHVTTKRQYHICQK